MSERSAESRVPGWFSRWSDPTVAAIVRIDRELTATRERIDSHRELMSHSLCLTCGRRGGVHTHVTPLPTAPHVPTEAPQ